MKPACGRQEAKKKLFAAWRLCANKKLPSAATEWTCLQAAKVLRRKKEWRPVRRGGLDRQQSREACLAVGRAQRNKGLSPEDAKGQRKNSLRLGGFARRKKKNTKNQKKNSAPQCSGPGSKGAETQRKSLCVLAPLREEKTSFSCDGMDMPAGS